jgi:hypothetical protein
MKDAKPKRRISVFLIVVLLGIIVSLGIKLYIIAVFLSLLLAVMVLFKKRNSSSLPPKKITEGTKEEMESLFTKLKGDLPSSKLVVVEQEKQSNWALGLVVNSQMITNSRKSVKDK